MANLNLKDNVIDASVIEKARQIKLLLLDVDGILTDGKLYFSNNGDELKAFNILDGHGIKMLQESGIAVGIVTGRKSELVAKRANDLGIGIVIQGSKDKGEAVREIAQQQNLTPAQIAFMGDDYPDLPAMAVSGLKLTVANAHPAVAERVDWQSTMNGGEGAVRDACDMLMKAQGLYDAALEKYL